jgi:hypothetical protein
MYALYMWKYCEGDNLDLLILTDLSIISTHAYENVVTGMTHVRLFAGMYACAPR